MWHALNPSDMRPRHRMLVSRITPLTSHVLPHRSVVVVAFVVDAMMVACAAAHTSAREPQAAPCRTESKSSAGGARALDRG